jgi:hypothetical protein
MKPSEIEKVIKNIDERTIRIEQILPMLATKEDLKAHPTRSEMTASIRDEGVSTRAHFDVVGEDLRQGMAVIAEGHKSLENVD